MSPLSYQVPAGDKELALLGTLETFADIQCPDNRGVYLVLVEGKPKFGIYPGPADTPEMIKNVEKIFHALANFHLSPDGLLPIDR